LTVENSGLKSDIVDIEAERDQWKERCLKQQIKIKEMVSLHIIIIKNLITICFSN
jgi:hypothetical protein